MRKRTILLFLCGVLQLLPVLGKEKLLWAAEGGLQPITIGVLARRGVEECLREWSPTATYLSEHIPGTYFTILPFDYESILSAVKENRIDFVVVNPSAYVEMQERYGVSRMATIKRITYDGVCTQYGSVIFCRSDRTDIDSMKDLVGKSFHAVNSHSFGGWQAAWRELKSSGINPISDFSKLTFCGTHDAVVYAVRDGKADSGAVATSILEAMMQEGKIAMKDFKIIHSQRFSDFPYACSTRLYPEWAFAKLRQISPFLAERVAVSLLDMPTDSLAAKVTGYAGWTAPLDYGSIDSCLKDLRAGIYENYGAISLYQLFSAYPYQSVAGVVGTGIMLWFLLYALRLNGQLVASQRRLQAEILEGRKKEDAASENAARLKAIFNATSDSVILFDPDGTILDLNETAAVVRHLRRDELLGRNLFEILPEEAGSLRRNAVRRILDERRQIHSEERRLFHYEEIRDGKWFSVRLFPVIDVNGNVSQIAGFSRDISDRKQAEAALKASEEKYRSMMESMDDAVYICSSDFRIEYQNSAMTRRVGGDATDKTCYRMVHGLAEPCPWCVREQVMAGEYLKTELMSPKDGKIYNISHSPIFHADGTVSKLAIFRDVTTLKKMTERLDQAQRMEAIGALAGGIAHDFNNILYPVIAMSELLLEELPFESEQRKNAAVIFQAAQRAGELVKQILSFSRQTTQEKMPVNVQRILNEVLNLMRSTIPADVEMVHSFEVEFGFVMAAPTQLHQVAMNLITNAFHAVEAKGGQITIELSEQIICGEDWPGCSLKPGSYVMISVSDTGHGIDPSLLGKIFEPYFTTKAVGKGTGLGLSVVHGIVKECNGDIRVDSELGKGTVFSVYLPVLEMTSPLSGRQSALPMATGTERILVVDDEEAIVDIEKKMLEKLGYHVTARSNSMEALTDFRAHPDAFDLVISDMTMPNLTGDRLAMELRRVRPGIPVIICTGFSSRLDQEKAESMGIKGFLMKPIVKSELAGVIRKVLDEAWG